MVEVNKLYLCELMIVTITFNQALLPHGYHVIFNEGQLIFLCEAYLHVFMRLCYPSNFCFKELRKCLSERFFKKDKCILLATEFEPDKKLYRA